jgi:hypothetical protein
MNSQAKFTILHAGFRKLIPGACLLVLLAGFSSLVYGAAKGSVENSPTVVRGTLGALPGKQPELKTPGKTYRLAGQSPYILHTLQDKRLLNQELQLVGTLQSNGEFVVQKLYAVHGGKLYKVQYYCDVCNITYVQPGHCFCCGRDTKLKEVPVSQNN